MGEVEGSKKGEKKAKREFNKEMEKSESIIEEIERVEEEGQPGNTQKGGSI